LADQHDIAAGLLQHGLGGVGIVAAEVEWNGRVPME
jgi:hypothetical protein